MSGYTLELPTLQNWSCHSCSGCCRQHGIAITEEERQRIAQQQWTAADGIPEGQPLFVRMGGWFGRRWWRLAHQPDGRCVFLDDRGLCRIHAKFGEAAKPLACRIYPYAFHPKGRQVVVSLRFSCPSVVKNLGRPVIAQKGELRDLARQVVPENISQAAPPKLTERTRLAWPDLLRVVHALDETLAAATAPVAVRLWRGLHWLSLVEQAKFHAVSGERLDELLDLLRGAAEAELPPDSPLASVPPPSRLGRTLFRLHAGQYARIDSYTSAQKGLAGRWRLFRAAVRLVRGTGTLPRLQERLAAVPFAALERSFGPLPAEADEMLTRYYRIKLEGLHFCGLAYYGIPLVEGFRSLALIYPVVLWIARWLAASQGGERLTADDVADALATADHHHGYSPALGSFGARSRVRTLAQTGDLERLIAWLSH